MRLYRTVCSTDWKCRPSHLLVFVGEGTKEELAQKMDEDVRDWMVIDVAAANEKDGVDDESKAYQKALKDNPDLPELWWGNQQNRWEMSRSEGNICRSFAENDGDGNRCTVVYHFLD